MSRNKIPHSVKGINKVALFFTFQCEKGEMHEYKVKFDQVNSAAKEGVDCLGRQHSLNGRKETLMCGVQGKELHLHKRRKRQP